MSIDDITHHSLVPTENARDRLSKAECFAAGAVTYYLVGMLFMNYGLALAEGAYENRIGRNFARNVEARLPSSNQRDSFAYGSFLGLFVWGASELCLIGLAYSLGSVGGAAYLGVKIAGNLKGYAHYRKKQEQHVKLLTDLLPSWV